jgi:hypothetical protein
MNLFNIEKSFSIMEKKGWDKVYWAVDIHETILKPNWDASKELPHEWYPHAKEVLQEISKRDDIILILYTCSYGHEIEQYLKFFKDNGVIFKYVNNNPDVKNTRYGNFESKFYFNVLLDDKCGFEGDSVDGFNDWFRISEILKKYPQVHKTIANK